jgi:hypothetical protein
MGGDIFNIITIATVLYFFRVVWRGGGGKVRVGEARYRLNNREKFNQPTILCNLHRTLCILKFVLTQVDDIVVYHMPFSTFKYLKYLKKEVLRNYV